MSGPILDDPGRRVGGRRSVTERHATLVGLVLSAVFHVILVLLYAVGLDRWGPTKAVIGVRSLSNSFSGMQVVRVVEIISPESLLESIDEELEFEPVLETEGVQPDVGPVEIEVADPGNLFRGVRAAEVLRVRSSDKRLWREARPELFELTEAERMELMLEGRLEIWADSVAAALATEDALTDWTTTDANGRRWGVSPGRIHLGDVTLPLPVYFSGTSWQREQATRRAWEDQDILNGANAQALRASWKERAEAIRRRKDRERRNTDVPPDTTRGFPGY
ncbi:MAG: hypothetical protein VYD78_03345 [Gemmatimonadota bacterium]|nr:hypothetical protein [Gemmatimonadota bacterium]